MDKRAAYPWILTIGGVLGLLASFVITLDKFKLLTDPKFTPSCSINPIFSCSPVMESAQASAFGFPNPIIGLVGFTAVIVVGISLLAKAKFPAWYWKLFNLGTLFGAGFVHWLFFQSVYRIEALCLWCMLVWSVTIPIFFYTTLRNLREGDLKPPAELKGTIAFIDRYHASVVLLWLTVIAALVLSHFWYYFKTIV